MPHDTNIELVAKEVFDVEDTLLVGQVYFEPLRSRMPEVEDSDWHPSDELWEPESFTDVREQLESVAQSFGVEHIPPPSKKVRSALKKIVEQADAADLTCVIIGSTMHPHLANNPLIPGMVALFSGWPTGARECVRWKKPSGARMVHWTTCSYDSGHILVDLYALWEEFAGMGAAGLDPLVDAELAHYPACA